MRLITVIFFRASFTLLLFGMTRTKKQNLEIIKSRLQVSSLPSKFENLPVNTIAIFVDNPDLDLAIQIIVEQNSTIKSANGRRLVAENKVELLLNKLKKSVTLTKSEIAKLWIKLFGKATKADDDFLREIGATSNESVREDLERAEQAISDAAHLVDGYQNKISKLTKEK
jgi:hypothetical protein